MRESSGILILESLAASLYLFTNSMPKARGQVDILTSQANPSILADARHVNNHVNGHYYAATRNSATSSWFIVCRRVDFARAWFG